MRGLNHDFKNLCQRNRDGSFATQHDRESILTLIANQLDEDGFRHLRAAGVRSKHVEHLVQRWHAEEISAGTFKNRMSALRWLAEKIDKQNIVARDNAAYGIAERQHVTNVSKAHPLDADKLAAVYDPYTALSLRLQEAQQLAGAGSLIPAEMSYGDRLSRKCGFATFLDHKQGAGWAQPGPWGCSSVRPVPASGAASHRAAWQPSRSRPSPWRTATWSPRCGRARA